MNKRLTELVKGKLHFVGGTRSSYDVVVYINIAKLDAPANHSSLEWKRMLNLLEVRHPKPQQFGHLGT